MSRGGPPTGGEVREHRHEVPSTSRARRLIVSVFVRSLPLLAAAERIGFDQLDVKFKVAANSTEQLAELASGDVDVAFTAADNIVKEALFAPGRLLVFQVATIGLDQFAVAASDVNSFDDVRGRDVGVDATDSGYALPLYALLAEHGLAAGDYRPVPVGGPWHRLKGLTTGELAVGLLNPGLTDRARTIGLSVLAVAAEHFPDYPNLVASTSTSTVNTRGDDLVAFGLSLAEGVRWTEDSANRDAAIDLLAAERRVPQAVAARLYDAEAACREVVLPDLPGARSSLSTVIRLRTRLGMGKVAVDDIMAIDVMRRVQG